jgi:2-oxo-4-hydroxy-4-carboxy-5-ureidoimidazoline decarboxylase
VTGERASLSVPELDRLPAPEAERLLASCCGSRAWVAGMLERRPFVDVARVVRAAEEVWWSLEPADWHEAFAHHPRIGERAAAAAQDGRAQAWSASEQRAVADGDATVRAALAEGNREYERRFGHIYLVSAAGKSADELLAILRARLANDPATELRVAAAEQAKITRSRLLRLVGVSGSPGVPEDGLAPYPLPSTRSP